MSRILVTFAMAAVLGACPAPNTDPTLAELAAEVATLREQIQITQAELEQYRGLDIKISAANSNPPQGSASTHSCADLREIIRTNTTALNAQGYRLSYIEGGVASNDLSIASLDNAQNELKRSQKALHQDVASIGAELVVLSDVCNPSAALLTSNTNTSFTYGLTP